MFAGPDLTDVTGQSMPADVLPSWRPGATRDSVVAFLDAVETVPIDERVACFDNDGTLWCERPTYVQFDFFVDALKSAVLLDPRLADVTEFSALLSGDRTALGEIGLERIAYALTGLFAGQTAEEFTARVRTFMSRATHPTLRRPLRANTYRPMLELIEALRERDFTICVVTGGGTEFVRAVSHELYGVPPQNIVGSLIDYDFVPTAAEERDGPRLLRTTRLVGGVNEGPVKVTNIQTQLGRRPIFAAGNSGGDREMLEWAATAEGPSLSLLIDHDDGEREFAYASTAESFVEPEPITDVGVRLGWTVVSMANDWDAIF